MRRKMRIDEIKVGDKVYTWYYGVRHVAEVIEIKESKARLRFKWNVENWRPISELILVK